LVGRIAGNNCYGAEKLQRITEVLDKETHHITAYSGHHTDLDLLRWAAKGFVVKPEKRCRHLAEGARLVCLDWRQ
jgi:phosphoserine phosphatase